MGLDVSHDCWHGAYSAFMRWRSKLAEVAGLPPLVLMEGFYRSNGDILSDPFSMIINYGKDDIGAGRIREICKQLPIKWDALKPNPLYELLYHSDCDGEIAWENCADIAFELEKLLPLLPNEDAGGHIGNWQTKTQCFVDGLREAYTKKENVDFH